MITLKNLSVSFGDTVALQSTNLAFQKKQFTILLGSSGAGKSTMIRSINRMQKPTSGSVNVEGLGSLENNKNLQAHRRQTGMIFQQHQLIGQCTVLQNVLMGRLGYYSTLRSFFPLPKREKMFALENLERVGLIDKALSRVDNLSGGQQQRVGIARALTQKPTIILADEPVASLDPVTADKVLKLLHNICIEDGITTILSLHQIDLAKRYADRIVGLAQGKVVFDAAPSELGDAQVERLYQQNTLVRNKELINASLSLFPLRLNTTEILP